MTKKNMINEVQKQLEKAKKTGCGEKIFLIAQELSAMRELEKDMNFHPKKSFEAFYKTAMALKI